MAIPPSLQIFASNWIMWAITLLGLSCYILLLNFIFSPRDAAWKLSLKTWLKTLAVLLSALPLLGLLGTIGGLLKTFSEMASDNGLDSQIFLSSGIAEALVTTQLGLVLVIPGWVLLAYLKSLYRKPEHIPEVSHAQ